MARKPTQDSEGDSVTGRIRRYAKVGTAVGGLAARLAAASPPEPAPITIRSNKFFN